MDGKNYSVAWLNSHYFSSLRTDESIKVVKELPLDRIMVESDAPWCEIRPSHASYQFIKTKLRAVNKEKHDQNLPVRSRNEPWASMYYRTLLVC